MAGAAIQPTSRQLASHGQYQAQADGGIGRRFQGCPYWWLWERSAGELGRLAPALSKTSSIGMACRSPPWAVGQRVEGTLQRRTSWQS